MGALPITSSFSPPAHLAVLLPAQVLPAATISSLLQSPMATLTPAAPAAEQADVEESQVCLPVHAFYAFDTLYCELTGHTPLAPKFSDDK